MRTKTTTLTFAYRIVLAILFSTSMALQSQTVEMISYSATWTVPANVTEIKVEAWGGGGGGGEASTGAGGGGGGGAYVTTTWSVTPGQEIPITIGLGGSGGQYLVNPNGKAGGATTVTGATGTLIALGGNGGTGGLGTATLTPPSYTNRNGNGGSGGIGHFDGGNGGSANNTAAGGGGGAGNASNGMNGTTSAAGQGGEGFPASDIIYNGGSGGGPTSSNGSGNNGSIPGGGGGGARAWNLPSGNTGGDGARGQVIITYTPEVCDDGLLTLTSAASTEDQSVCFGVPIDTIRYTVSGGATGAYGVNLPTGVTTSYLLGVFKIYGTPASAGTYPCMAITSGTPSPCLNDTVNFTITVHPAMDTQTGYTVTFDTDSAWQVPDGVTSLAVEAWGGGGAGGGAELTFTGIGGGGGGGAYAINHDLTVTPYDTLSVVVAGSATGAAAQDGTDGGHSTITGYEALIYAAGGKGGDKAIALGSYPQGGAGGLASDSYGDCTVSGSDGTHGYIVTAVLPPPLPQPNDGAGGRGAIPSGGNGGAAVGSFIGNGNAGTGPGGGGSGSRSGLTLALNTTGGNGAAGRIRVHYFCPDVTSYGQISADQTICYNTAPQLFHSLSEAVAVNGSVDYQWQSSEESASAGFTDIDAAIDSTFQSDTLTATTWFRRLTKSKCSQTWAEGGISNIVKITVRPQLIGGAIDTTGEEICSGSIPGLIDNITLASGGDQNISYSWQSSLTGLFDDALDIPGATAISYQPSSLTASTTYRRLAKDGTCRSEGVPASGAYAVEVNPPTVGGDATGGVEVCYGSNSTLLSVENHVGDVIRWQSSADDQAWSDIPGATDSVYTAVDLTEPAYYRAVVKSGLCDEEFSASTAFTIFADYHISGYARYNNNPLTPLNGLKVLLSRKYAGGSWSLADSVVTSASGYYEFSGLTNAQYSLHVKSASPTGQWQTWGGVTNSDYLLVSQHVAGSSLLQVDPPVVRVSASVRVPHPLINSLDAITIRQAAKFPATGWSFFDIPKWVFSGLDQSTRIDTFAVNCENVTRDIRGLCAGDVNGTFIPGNGYKVAGTGLELANQGMIPVTDEMTFAVRLVETNPVETHGSASQKTQETHCRASLQSGTQTIGAITLFMNYDPKQIEILNITMQDNAGIDPWFETNNGVLYIGWISTEPISVIKNQPVLLVHTRLVAKSAPIRFTLNETLVSELADGDGNVIEGVRLAMPVAGIDETHGVETHDVETHDVETHCRASLQATSQTQSEIIVYPNPVRESLNVEYTTGNTQPSTCNLQLLTLSGKVVLNLQPATLTAGWNKTTLDLSGLAPGIYLLKVKMNGELFHKKVVVTR